MQDPWNLKFQVGAAGDGQDRRLQAPVKKRRSEKYSAESACKAAPPELVDIRLFDIFTSKDIGKDRRSFAYSLAFRAPDRTLTDDEVNRAFAKIAEALKTTLQVDVRDN